ncbi:AAA family ATPase, partial [Staphylococcus aureus]
MKRPITKIALLIGPAGVGKTAIVETWLKRRRKIKPNLAFFTIDLGALSKDGNSVLQARLEKLLPLLEKYEKLLQEEKPDAEVVLFIDEFHRLISIFGSGTKAGGDTIKPYIARPTIKLITATTETEFENYIANDDAFDRRLKPLPVKEQNKEVIKHILQESWLS